MGTFILAFLSSLPGTLLCSSSASFRSQQSAVISDLLGQSTAISKRFRDGRWCICWLVVEARTLLLQGIPGVVGWCRNHDLPLLQSLLWRKESSEVQTCTLIGPPHDVAIAPYLCKSLPEELHWHQDVCPSNKAVCVPSIRGLRLRGFPQLTSCDVGTPMISGWSACQPLMLDVC
ncbi:hypothetical protein MHYP_G00056960 [Metynnis hypsauchen]